MRKALMLLGVCVAMIIPSSAQVSASDAMETCRNQVQLDAINRLGAPAIRFRHTDLLEHDGSRYRVDGTFVAGLHATVHTFVCSVDPARGNLRWILIDSKKMPCTSAGSADRIEYTDVEVVDICRDVVRRKVFDHGYLWSDFRWISIDDSGGVIGRISGKVMGETAGHQNLFRYSCQVDRRTGEVRSVQLEGH